MKTFSFSAPLSSFPLHVHPFFIHLCYFTILSLFGFMGLKVSKARSPVTPNDLDLFYTSVSASTVSSMTAVEMEAFSNPQLILLTFLMFLGGEVFTSFLQLSLDSLSLKQEPPVSNNQFELGFDIQISDGDINVPNATFVSFDNRDINKLKHNSLRYLSRLVFGYLFVANVVGSVLVSLYMSVTSSARQVLREKGIKILTFSAFTIVSSFASCGYVPTNENMMIVKKNSGLLLLILPHIFLGSTLYPPCLRLVIWVLRKVSGREEFSYLLENWKKMGCAHLLSGLHCWLLVATVLVFNLIQFVMFCSMEWNSQIMEGMNLYEKVVASLFQVANSRHTGESAFDLSSVSSAVLVLFVVMMYLPPYTTFLPIRDEYENDGKIEKRSLLECLVLSQLSYLVIFIILICITEGTSLREDPLNFNVFNITIEVISAYGNVGFSTGYSCARQLKGNEGRCKDSWVGFSGKWTNKGKFILILVMFFGRLKRVNMKGGKAWDLS